MPRSRASRPPSAAPTFRGAPARFRSAVEKPHGFIDTTPLATKARVTTPNTSPERWCQ